MNELIHFDVGEINVYSLDEYHAKCKPDEITQDGTPIWNSKSYTKIGSLVEKYKIQKNKQVSSELVKLFIQSNIMKNNCYDVIIPIPSLSNTLHISDIAKEIALQLDIDFCDCLKKTSSDEMKFLFESERKKQQDFIICSDEIKKFSSILLIDDIMKTGTTISNCVDKIKEKNAECNITGFVFCRGMRI